MYNPRFISSLALQAAAANKKVTKAKKEVKKYVINGATPADDKMVDMEAFSTFLQGHIKVAGKTGNLGTNVTVALDGNKITVTVAPTIPFSKRCASLSVVFRLSYFTLLFFNPFFNCFPVV